LILRETKLLDLRIADRSEPCLMTCYLDYTRMGKLEVLEGTFISVDVKGKRDCGSGKIYLERVSKSDFKKEEFLVKKKPEARPTPKILLPEPAPRNRGDNLAVKPIPGRPGTQQGANQNPSAKAVPKITRPATQKTGAQPNPSRSTAKTTVPKKEEKVKTTVPKPEEKKTDEPVQPNKEELTVTQPRTEQNKRVPVPKVLVERENNLVKVINTTESELVISLYDNGTIDNDTISLYHNNELVISNKKLTYSPLEIKIHCSKTDPRHELVVVAENLGDIPPNTALMVVTTPGGGRMRFEIFLASNETRNAKVIINYTPKD
jgi:hypothetical protein